MDTFIYLFPFLISPRSLSLSHTHSPPQRERERDNLVACVTFYFCPLPWPPCTLCTSLVCDQNRLDSGKYIELIVFAGNFIHSYVPHAIFEPPLDMIPIQHEIVPFKFLLLLCRRAVLHFFFFFSPLFVIFSSIRLSRSHPTAFGLMTQRNCDRNGNECINARQTRRKSSGKLCSWWIYFARFFSLIFLRLLLSKVCMKLATFWLQTNSLNFTVDVALQWAILPYICYVYGRMAKVCAWKNLIGNNHTKKNARRALRLQSVWTRAYVIVPFVFFGIGCSTPNRTRRKNVSHTAHQIKPILT